MSTQKTVWPVLGYWIGFNPKTHAGTVALQLDADAPPDVTFQNLTADDVTALVAILARGGAQFYSDSGTIGIKG